MADKLACSQMRINSNALFDAVVVALLLKVTTLVDVLMAVILVSPAGNVVEPDVILTGIPTRRLVTLGKVTVLVASVRVTLLNEGLLAPTRNLTNTQAASHQLLM